MGGTTSRGFKKIAEGTEARILMLGLDCAGKTSMLYRMKRGEPVVTAPTIGFNVEALEFRNMNFTVWDIGSQNGKIRPLWRHYFKETQGLIFVVDSTDHARIDVARAELAQILGDKSLTNTATLVLANKQDLPGAMSAGEVAAKLGLHEQQRSRWTVMPACAVDGSGLTEALDWLAAELDAPARGPSPRRLISSL
jgi:small GTP-binding protein